VGRAVSDGVDPLWPAVWLSLRIACASTVLTALLVVPLAWALARAGGFRGRSVVEALILLPLVLPPTVVGYAILVLFGARGWVGRHVYDWTGGYAVTFRFEGAVLAAVVVSVPLLYLPARAAFASVDRELEDVARLLGATRLRLFWHVSLPMARRSIAGGLLLAFARALGEFGATAMVFGMQQGRLTLPIRVYVDHLDGELTRAAPAVAALTLASLAVIVAYNRSPLSRQE